MSLEKTQTAFQSYLLDGDRAIAALVPDGPRAAASKLLNVYRHAYGARLVECLQHDFPKLHAIIGDAEFDKLARLYTAEYPSQHRSVRWLGADLAAFMKNHDRYGKTVSLHEMAAFEWALGLAFDAADAAPLEQDILKSIPPAAWPSVRFSFHPSVLLLPLYTDVPGLWAELENGAESVTPPPPSPVATDWLVWRMDLTVRYRSLAEDEAAALRLAIDGTSFADICEALGRYIDIDQAAFRAAELLSSWLNARMIIDLTVEGEISS